MTDYLEILEGNADVLWEETRQLDRSLSGLWSAEGEERREALQADGGREMVERLERTVRSEQEKAPMGADVQSQTLAVRQEGRERTLTWGVLPPEKRDVPLLEELEKLERAVWSPATGRGLLASGRAGNFGGEAAKLRGRAQEVGAALLGRKNDGQGQIPPGVRGELYSDGEIRRADKIFRRDSRRYDGGFYLY